jgi:DNA modification methylase
LLARHLDNPLVAKAKNEQEAINILRKELHKDFVGELAALNVASVVASKHTLQHGDSRVILRDYPPGRFDVILADPPYGIGADAMIPQGGSDSGVKHEYQDDLEYAVDFFQQSIEEWYRVARSEAHLYMFCHIAYWAMWGDMASKVGWNVWPVPLIWDKMGAGNIIGNVDGPRRTYEAILYARKGPRGVQRVGADVLHHAPTRSKRHAAEKPVSLYIELLSFSCIPGQLVLDPCCGSGTIFPAANTIGLIAVGIEGVEDHCNTARLRMEETAGSEVAALDDIPF